MLPDEFCTRSPKRAWFEIFRISNSLPFKPRRFCQKITGLPESTRMAILVTARIGISKKGQSPQQRHRVCASLSTEPGRAELIAVLSGGQNCLLHSPEEQSPQIGRVAEKPVQVGPSGSREFARSAYRRSIPPPIGFAQPRFTERD